MHRISCKENTAINKSTQAAIVGKLFLWSGKLMIDNIKKDDTMIREWATVISWQDGIAFVLCKSKISCGTCTFCASRSNSHILDMLVPQTSYIISVPSKQQMMKGQKVKLGISKKSLLRLAILIYLFPLAGLFVVAGFFQMFFSSDFVTMCGALLGTIGGFLLAKSVSAKLAVLKEWRISTLCADIPFTIRCIKTSSSAAR